MKIWGMVLGGYPRNRFVRYALRDRERGVAPLGHDVHEVERAAAQIIGVQHAAGLPIVVDGMVDWHDVFRPFVEAWRNTSVDGLLRYFDNNFFYRIPVFTGEPDPKEYILPRRVLRFKDLAEPARLKVVLPGPVTFAFMSRNHSGIATEELAERIAYILREEVFRAVEAGAGFIQIDEPFLADIDATRDHARLMVDLVNGIVKGVEDKTCVSLYFNVPDPGVYDEVLNVKARYLMIDVADAPQRARDLLASKGLGGHIPVLGVVDARRIIDDDPGQIEGIVKQVMGEEVVLTTSTWLDLIPYKYAVRKTIVLGRLVEDLAKRNGWEAHTIWG